MNSPGALAAQLQEIADLINNGKDGSGRQPLTILDDAVVRLIQDVDWRELVETLRACDTALQAKISPTRHVIDLLSTARTVIDEEWDREHDETIALLSQIDNVLGPIADAEGG